jgi:hypothetical protein
MQNFFSPAKFLANAKILQPQETGSHRNQFTINIGQGYSAEAEITQADIPRAY